MEYGTVLHSRGRDIREGDEKNSLVENVLEYGGFYKEGTEDGEGGGK